MVNGRNDMDEWMKTKTTLEKGYWHSGLGDEFSMHMVKAKMPLRPIAGFVFNGCEFFTATLCKINSCLVAFIQWSVSHH